MDDLISRQAAIDIERNATVDTNPMHFEAHQKFTQFMDDAEISSFGRWQWSNGFNTALTAVGIDLKKLPSAQPDPCDDPRADIYYLAEKIGIHRLYALVVELRGEPEPCKDAVSRKAAIDALMIAPQDWDGMFIQDLNVRIREKIEALPSAQTERKTGKWVRNFDGNEWYWFCSNCKEEWYEEDLLMGGNDFPNFCPNCGADMRGDKDENQDS